MTLNELLAELQNRSSWNDANYTDRWTTFLNLALREHSRRMPWAALEDYLEQPATGRYLILPPYVDTVRSVHDITNHRSLAREGDFDLKYPVTFSQGTTGRIYSYEQAGEVPALADPTGYVTFRSSHASDVFPVYVTGFVAQSGASGTALASSLRTLTLDATGQSPVTLTTLFTKFISISKATDSNGDYFFEDQGNSGAHISQVLAFEHLAAFKRLQFHFVPDATTLLRIRYRAKPLPLRAGDQGLAPGVKADFLIEQALAYHYREQGEHAKAAAQTAQAQLVLAGEATKERHHNEPYGRLVPDVGLSTEPSADHFPGWYR